ncbi:MAG: T9SS type A sorting domain-containing protein [bacterium]|nr:T9SS type A sorting domain-containing protein [bacterium]
MKQIIVLMLTAVSFGSYAQLLNGGFENWNNLIAHAYDVEMADSHLVSNPYNGSVNNWIEDSEIGICQTTDGFEGNYAMIVQNWYSYVKGRTEQTITINDYPAEISGMYRYRAVSQGDEGQLEVLVTDILGDTAIHEVFVFTGQEEWAAFSFPLPAPQSTASPANMTVRFTSGLNNCDGVMMTCNLLYLDALEVGFSTASTMENSFISNITMYPNPAENLVKFSEQIDGLVIHDLRGREVYRSELVGKEFSFNLPAGVYIATLQTENGEQLQRLKVR